MASISVYNIGQTSFSVRLTGLQTEADGVDYIREVRWFAYNRNYDEWTEADHLVFIGTDQTEGGEYTFTGMVPGRDYYVKCEVYRSDTIALIDTLKSETFTTLYENGKWEWAEYATLGEISSQYWSGLSRKVQANYTYRWSFTPKYSGVLKVWTATAYNLQIFLSISTSFDSGSGYPVSYMEMAVEGDDPVGTLSGPSMIQNVQAGTTYYVWLKNAVADYSAEFQLYILPPEQQMPPTRPENFEWTYPKEKGGEFNLTDKEWNSYTEKINEFLLYKGLSKCIFDTAYTGNDFTAHMYEQARTAVQDIEGYGAFIPQVYKGQEITADMMNILVSELNAIP